VRNVAEEKLKKAKRQIAKAELAEKEALKRVGIAVRAAEREKEESKRSGGTSKEASPWNRYNYSSRAPNTNSQSPKRTYGNRA
jgi:hypothetical protein